MKKAFTLAELLIVLGILGIVAALTMPILIQNHTKSVVVTRLQKFYSIMNQAIDLAEAENGDKKVWYNYNAAGLDDEGNSKTLTWYNKYLAKHIKTIKVTVDNVGRPTFYLADGSAFKPRHNTALADWLFYPGNPDKCNKKYSEDDSIGRCAFVFIFRPNLNSSYWIMHYDKGMEPHKYDWNGSRDDLKNNANYGCNNKTSYKAYCTALIQYDGWKISDDYPLKVSY